VVRTTSTNQKTLEKGPMTYLFAALCAVANGEDGTEAVCGERESHGLDQRRWPAGRRATRDHRSRPVVSILWGTPASGETVRGGFRLVLAVISARGHRRRNRRAVPLTAGQRRRRRTGTARGGKREAAMTGPGPRRNGLT